MISFSINSPKEVFGMGVKLRDPNSVFKVAHKVMLVIQVPGSQKRGNKRAVMCRGFMNQSKQWHSTSLYISMERAQIHGLTYQGGNLGKWAGSVPKREENKYWRSVIVFCQRVCPNHSRFNSI